METELLCNFKKCRKSLSSQAWVTSCSHIFCYEDGLREFEKAFVCPACDTQLPGKYDAVRIDLNPTEQYKSMVLAGQRPEVILEICTRAIAFWTYQVHQEIMFQEYISTKAKERTTQLEKYYENVLEKSKHELDHVKTQLDGTKTELEVSKKKTAELSEKLTERGRQYQKLQSLYEALRRKFISPSFFERQSSVERLNERSCAPFRMAAANEILCPNEPLRSRQVKNSNFTQAEKDFVLRPARTPTCATPLQGHLLGFSAESVGTPSHQRKQFFSK